MFIELIDALRCIRPHEDSWLVGAFDEMQGRNIVAGTLGCPVCEASYPIVDGVARFGAPPAGGSFALEVRHTPEEAMRLAAMLDLVTGRGLVVLVGEWGVAARALSALAEDVQLLLANAPPDAVRAGLDAGASALIAPDILPVAAASCRGVALGGAAASAAMLASATRALAAGGRLVAPAAAPIPEGMAELARDEQLWVAERRAPGAPLLALHRGGRRVSPA